MASIFFGQPDPLELRVRMGGRRQLWVWLPPLIAVVVIAIESTGTFSANHTSRFLRPLYEELFGRVGDARWEEIHHVFRKCGHFFGYGMVCLTFLWSWLITLGKRMFLGVGQWRLGASLLAVLSTAVVASGDEIHQSFLPSRTGQLSDVGIDTGGAVLCCVVVWGLGWRGGRGGRMRGGIDAGTGGRIGRRG